MYFTRAPLHGDEVDAQIWFAFTHIEAGQALAAPQRWQETVLQGCQRIVGIRLHVTRPGDGAIATGTSMCQIPVHRARANARSDERREGKEWVRTFSTRGAQ